MISILSHTTTSTKLNKKNFDNWYTKICRILREKGIKKYIESDFLNDLINENKKKQILGQPTIEIARHIKKDTQAIQIITNSLTSELISGIVNFQTSFRMMEKLKRDYIENYEGLAENLYLKLANIRASNLQESVKIIDKINKIFKQLDIAENPLKDNEKSKFLYSSISEDAIEHFNVHLANNYDKLCRYFKLSVHMKNIKDIPNYKSNISSLDLRNENDSENSFGNGNIRGYEIDHSHSHSQIYHTHSHSHSHPHMYSHTKKYKNKHTYGNIHSRSNSSSHSHHYSYHHSHTNTRSSSRSDSRSNSRSYSSSNPSSRSNSRTQLHELAHSSSTLSKSQEPNITIHSNRAEKHPSFSSHNNSSISLSNTSHSKHSNKEETTSLTDTNSKCKSKLQNKKSSRNNKYKHSKESSQLHVKNSYVNNNSSFYIVEKALASLEKKN
ncbi:hypothetical protein BCR36DRAFT_402187 [Piromyces finnis]|uniref:Uncharacterized protein n=1 Tax=Piromyces finnis TaxID=1754191 RepID=A0A1Y1VJ90_9FUNG|nr:hypothetical protein BCR36DRAFT_402187 [Piromyces finnis]|eukprot:ORX57782.1 hypothetical protein BCR36DRAFT_402187 [Piromyces finnis]